jgi:H+/Cl- antiporter ClcA
MKSWETKDTLIVIVLAIVGTAIGLAVGASHEQIYRFNQWLQYRPEQALPWAIVGLITGAGLGLVARLFSK